MGLWSKGVRRSESGLQRLEDVVNPVNEHVLEEIRKYIDRSGTLVEQDRNYKCQYHYSLNSPRTVIFRVYGFAFSIDIPEGKDNIPWIMQTLGDAMQPVLHNRYIKTTHVRRLDCLHRNIMFNTQRWAEQIPAKDETFLHVEYDE